MLRSSFLFLLAATSILADYEPQIKTKGTVQAGDIVVFYDGSGRYVCATSNLPGFANTLGGDATGFITNATVVKIRNIAVAPLSPGEEEDGYGLKYDHASQTLLLGPVATEGGNSISNILRLSGTAVVTDVAVTNIGIYRTIRPGDLPSMALNVGGYEAAYVDLLGITLKAGSIHLLSDVLAVNPAAYDGTVAAPAYTWDADRDLGKYRMSYNGDYAEAYCVTGELVWFWARDGLHLTNGAALYGVDYVAAWIAGAGLTNAGTASNPTGALDTATQASLLLADSSVQPAEAAAISNLAQAAHDTGLVSSNWAVNLSNSWFASVAYLILADDTNRWNTAGLTVTAVSNLCNAVAASAAHLTSNNTFTGSMKINGAPLAVGRSFGGSILATRGIAGGYASAHDIITSNDACVAFGRASDGPIVAGGNVTGPAIAIGNDVQAVATHTASPSFAMGRGVTNSGYDSWVWSAGQKYTNTENGAFVIVPSNTVDIIGGLSVSGFTICPTQYYFYVSATNWSGSWSDYAARYVGCNSNGTLRVITNTWGWE